MYLKLIPMHGGETQCFVTSDELEKLKQRARKLKREQKIPHYEALELVARSARFANWHQVVEAHKAMQPTEHAVRDGVVIAMDVKEAVNMGAGIDLGIRRGPLCL